MAPAFAHLTYFLLSPRVEMTLTATHYSHNGRSSREIHTVVWQCSSLPTRGMGNTTRVVLYKWACPLVVSCDKHNLNQKKNRKRVLDV